MLKPCSGCGTELHTGSMIVHGFDHRTNEEVFTCRKCLLEAAAQANLVLAHRRLALVRLQAKDGLTPLVKT